MRPALAAPEAKLRSARRAVGAPGPAIVTRPRLWILRGNGFVDINAETGTIVWIGHAVLTLGTSREQFLDPIGAGLGREVPVLRGATQEEVLRRLKEIAESDSELAMRLNLWNIGYRGQRITGPLRGIKKALDE